MYTAKFIALLFYTSGFWLAVWGIVAATDGDQLRRIF